MIPEILGSAGVTGIAILVGILIYRAGLGSPAAFSSISIGSPNPGASCAEACANFNDRRADRCRAEFAERASRMAMEAARSAYWAAVAALTTMAALAVATGFSLPWPVNLIVSLVFWTAATVLTGVMIFKMGKLDAATTQWQADNDMLVLANTRVMESRAIVNANCPPEAAAACLNTPNPC